MRAPVGVIDTNVLVAGIITGDAQAPAARIVDAMLAGAFPFLLSIELLAEYRAVLLRPKIAPRHGLSEEEVDAVLVALASMAAMREPARPEGGEAGVDARLLALVATHDEAVLVTGDRALLDGAPDGRAESPASFAVRLPVARDRR
jgi:uncharacterized protein